MVHPGTTLIFCHLQRFIAKRYTIQQWHHITPPLSCHRREHCHFCAISFSLAQIPSKAPDGGVISRLIYDRHIDMHLKLIRFPAAAHAASAILFFLIRSQYIPPCCHDGICSIRYSVQFSRRFLPPSTTLAASPMPASSIIPIHSPGMELSPVAGTSTYSTTFSVKMGLVVLPLAFETMQRY